jgi:hypothetical protein
MRGLFVCMLRASVRCGVRGLLAIAVLGDTRHDADVVLWWVGLVAPFVSARACLWCDVVGERGASVAASLARCTMRVRGVHCRRCLDRSVYGALPQYCDCGFVLSRVRCCTASRCGYCMTAQRCVGLFQRLIGRVCASRCASSRVRYRRVAVGPAVLRVCCRWRRRQSLAVHVAH